MCATIDPEKKDTKESTNQGSIAIIGMAGIFPEAENLSRYWENILGEINCIREVPASRWKIEDYYDANPSAMDKSYCKHGGFIPDIQFDPMEFGLPPNILEVTDVSQLLGLTVARDALTDAGYPEKGREIYDKTGVVLGMVGMSSKLIQPLLNRLQYPVWEKVLRASAVPEQEIPAIIEKMKLAYLAWNENAFPGAIGNVVAGRIANRFDLGGTNCIVDAACGSSLAAVSMAVNELLLGRADMMITGGVDTDNSILTYLCFSKTPAFSKGDHLRAFSAESDGMLVGEGIGMLVLKRLVDAQRDEDRIYALIRGVGTSSDGYFKSIYAPRSTGQAKAIRRAYAIAGYPPQSVGLIEAHGTGTNAGDPAEFEGLKEAFGENNGGKQTIALGSIKSQIGHTKATAGAASLIKTALALHHKVLPATINVTKPNPVMDIANSSFYLNTETRPWFKSTEEYPRRAGVSSFGFGGTNFHITLEEYENGEVQFNRIQSKPYAIILSADSNRGLVEKCKELQNRLGESDAQNYLFNLDTESTTAIIPTSHVRLGFLAVNVEDANDKIKTCLELLEKNKEQECWSNPKGIFYRAQGMETDGKIVALFPGQGSQYINMGRELAISFPSFRGILERANSLLTVKGREPLTSIVFPIPVFSDTERNGQQERLTATENAQPAIGVISMGMFNLLREAGFKADFLAGHSFGELTALWAAGVLDDDAFLDLAIARGEAMTAPSGPHQDMGSMAAVKGDAGKVGPLLSEHADIQIANFNSPTQVVLAGSSRGIQEIKPIIEKEGLSVVPLKVSAAFHTSFVKHAKAPFDKAIKNTKFTKPVTKVYANTTSGPYPDDPQKIGQTISDQLLNPVRFSDEVEKIHQAGGRIFIEFGPKNILSNLVKEILNGEPHEIITLNPNSKGDSDLQFRQAVLQMRLTGLKLGDVDPYRQNQNSKKASPSKVAVKLNGGLYTTEERKKKFEDAVSKKTNINYLSEKSEMASQNQTEKQLISSDGEVRSMNETHPNIGSLITLLQEHQTAVLKAHEQFLNNDLAVNASLNEITRKELEIFSRQNGNGDSPIDNRSIDSLTKQAEFITSQHASTGSAHLEFIKSQTTFSQQYTALIQQLMKLGDLTDFKQSDPATNAINETLPKVDAHDTREKIEIITEKVAQVETKPLVPSMNVDSEVLRQSFLRIVSDKTGYPADMLELSMDMEADLGIDSIKRVEILGAMQEQYPQLPLIKAEDLVALRTLEQVINTFTSSGKEPNAQTIAAPAEEPKTANEKMTNATISSKHTENIEIAFLEIVAEKTGYPADMLEPSMDMEADLGIDSIKRVEILGAVQEKYPHLPTVNAAELVELRTLEQVIAKFKGQSKDKESPVVVESAPAGVEKEKENQSVKTYPVIIKQLPRPDLVDINYPPDSMAIITDDLTETTTLLAEALINKGVDVGIVHLRKKENKNNSESPENIQHFYIEAVDEKNVQKTMEAIIKRNKKIIAFVHLNSAGVDHSGKLLDFSNANAETLKAVFLMARHLKKSMEEAAGVTRTAFMTVTRMDGQLGLNGYSAADPLPGGFAGLTKSLRKEWGSVYCRDVDIHPSLEPKVVIEKVMDELQDANLLLTEVGYTSTSRYTISLREMD